MSDAAVEQAEAASKAAAVHAGDLVPITRAEAARRVTFDGEHLPALPATRRVLPAPFRRQRIAVEHHGRAWTGCRADQLAPGDIVPGIGRLISAVRATRYAEVAGVPGVATGVSIYIRGAGGVEQVLDPAEQVRAFRLAK